MSRGQTFPAGELPGSRRIWVSSSTVVLATHIMFAAGLVAYRPVPPVLPPPMPSVLLDLTPAPVAAARPLPAEPPSPRQAAPVVPEPVPELVPAPVRSEVALPKPKPKAKPPRPEPRMQQPLPVPVPAEAIPAAQPATQPAAEPAAAREPASSPPARAPSNAIPTWQGLLSSHLERYKRYPAMAQARRQQGVSMVRFVMDRNGKVLSAALEQSSGVERLDRESLELLERADPLPAPPADVVGARIELVVPIRFFLKS